MTYVQGFVLPVPETKKAAYREMAESFWSYLKKHGAIETMEAWGVDLPKGETTDFHRAVKAEEGETVVFSWIIWPDRETCDKAAAAMQSDPDMQMPGDMPFDGKRMFWGGFEPIWQTSR
ncbi:DUF1428 domain-containing protein [Pacificimonas flava]|uniref:RNA signal recognition particle n=1 Tax=Pacificimonas flava TaxID=1234595 RepID=M2TKM2_9SPHN|nr:DUF1428 domain-containing protein [Pacificimonas flava]EMD82216.1 hypothetical protein C725_2502 [Pacificimonas flava]MBB5280306.1 uncharacterized protein YbaA (DUF1428 family) [Pacificimonas flava]